MKATPSQLIQSNLGTSFSLTPSPLFFWFVPPLLNSWKRKTPEHGKLASFGRKPEQEECAVEMSGAPPVAQPAA